MNGIIYRYTNFANGKVYIGQTKTSVAIRGRLHKYNAMTAGQNNRFYCAIRKYGLESFHVDVLESGITTQSELDSLEKFWIAVLRSMSHRFGYNMTEGGSVLIHTDEIRRKMKENHHHHRATVEQRKHISAAAKLVWQSLGYRERMSKIHLASPNHTSRGKNLSDLHRSRISKSVKKAMRRPDIRTRQLAGIRIRDNKNKSVSGGNK